MGTVTVDGIPIDEANLMIADNGQGSVARHYECERGTCQFIAETDRGLIVPSEEDWLEFAGPAWSHSS